MQSVAKSIPLSQFAKVLSGPTGTASVLLTQEVQLALLHPWWVTNTYMAFRADITPPHYLPTTGPPGYYLKETGGAYVLAGGREAPQIDSILKAALLRNRTHVDFNAIRGTEERATLEQRDERTGKITSRQYLMVVQTPTNPGEIIKSARINADYIDTIETMATERLEWWADTQNPLKPLLGYRKPQNGPQQQTLNLVALIMPIKTSTETAA